MFWWVESIGQNPRSEPEPPTDGTLRGLLDKDIPVGTKKPINVYESQKSFDVEGCVHGEHSPIAPTCMVVEVNE